MARLARVVLRSSASQASRYGLDPAWRGMEALEPRVLLSGVLAEFEPVAPLGSLVNQSSAFGQITVAGQIDTYTVDLEAGQTLAVAADPGNAGLDLSLQIRDSVSSLIASGDRGGPGKGELIQALPVLDAGTYTIAVVAAAGTGTYDVSVVLNASLEGAGTVSRFDFGTSSSPLAPGYTQISENDAYDARLGHGWTAGGIASTSRTGPDDLRRDLNRTNDGTFAVDVANGDYRVTVIQGQKNVARDEMELYLEGVLVDTITTDARQFNTAIHVVTVNDGQLTLRLRDNGGVNRHAVINALHVVPLDLANLAVDIDDSFIDVGTGVRRGAVVGSGAGTYYHESQVKTNVLSSHNVSTFDFQNLPEPTGDGTLTVTTMSGLGGSISFLSLDLEGLVSKRLFELDGQTRI